MVNSTATDELNAVSAITMVVIVAFLAVVFIGFFGYTCTSGTFKMDKFDASNCFVIEALLESNANASTETLPTTVPEAPCGDFTTLNCPTIRCQVDEIQGVCEDTGEPLEEVDCHLAVYQTVDTCPVVGCEWGNGQCAQPGKLCGYESDIQRCKNRDDCNWDYFRPSYSVCLPKSQPATDGACEDLGAGREADCTAAPGCTWSDGSCATTST
jgi:hypothetical protein